MARRMTAVLSAVSLGLATLPLLAAPAQAALEAGVAFTAAALPTWQTDGIVWAAASAGDRVFVGGDFAAIRPPGTAVGDAASLPRSNLAVFDGATGEPLSCGPNVTGSTNASVRALEVSPDGKTLYIGGSFTAVGSTTGRKHLAALDIESCTAVASFAPQPSAMVRAVKATASAVYFGGGMGYVGTTVRRRAAAVQPVGTSTSGRLLDWNPQFDDEVRAIVLRPGGTEVVIGGEFDTVNGVASNALAVVHPVSGANLHVYPGFIESRSAVKALAVDDTGFYTGNEGTGLGKFDGRIAVDWATHRQRWRDNCLGATQAVVVYSGRLYSGSHAHDCSTNKGFPDGPRHHLLAQSVTDPTLLPWFPQTDGGIGEKLGPRAMVVSRGSSGDHIWVVGEFTRVNGVPQQGLTRFGEGPQEAGPSTPTASVTNERVGMVRVAWRQSFDADDATLTYNVFRNGTDVPLHTAATSSWFWSRKQMTFLDEGVTPGLQYAYRVTVTDGSRTVSSPSISVVATGGQTAAPPPPTVVARPAPPPLPDAPGTKRLAGADRYSTAAAIVRDAFPRAPAPVVFIATGETFADALAGGPAAHALGGPVLPVAKATLPAPIRSELTRLKPTRIVILGGPDAVSDVVAAELRGFTTGTVTRMEGVNRYATAARVATSTFTAPVPQVLIANSDGFADALTGGAVGAKTNSPVLLVSRTSLPAETAAALRRLEPRSIAVLGGTAAVSDTVLQQLHAYAVGGTVNRLAGNDRYATAARLTQSFWPQTSRVVYLATGRDFPDALSGVPAAGRDAAPLLLVEPNCIPAPIKRELSRLQPTTIVVLGGTTAVSAVAARTVCGAASAPPANREMA